MSSHGASRTSFLLRIGIPRTICHSLRRIPAVARSISISLPYGNQILWPDHCVEGTSGAEFHPQLKAAHCELIIRKGFHREIDSYSAFFENDRQTPTGLTGYLRERRLTRIYIVGLATDFCVAYTALDARKLGFEVTVIEAGCTRH